MRKNQEKSLDTMLKVINCALEKNYFPVVLKYLSLVAYVGLIIAGLSATSTDPVFLKELRNTNFGNLIVWSYWWPAIIVVAIFFGRFWCMVCPVEIITSFFAKIGFKHKRPKWLLSGWATTIAQKIVDGEIVLTKMPFMVNLLVSVLLTLVIAAGIWLSIKVVKRLNKAAEITVLGKSLYLIPVVYGGVFIIMIIFWRWTV